MEALLAESLLLTFLSSCFGGLGDFATLLEELRPEDLFSNFTYSGSFFGEPLVLEAPCEFVLDLLERGSYTGVLDREELFLTSSFAFLPAIIIYYV